MNQFGACKRINLRFRELVKLLAVYLHLTLRVDGKEVFLALSLRPLHTTHYIDKDGKMGMLALQPLHTIHSINKGEASIIANREVVSLDGLRSYKSSPCCSSFV
mmetsp:Transcript_3234/g.6812  ORF Transcript_3234/g.6812 Transcript_3234/m.6812 type:complete len:104 (+) Transcript_3234:557-868(+)